MLNCPSSVTNASSAIRSRTSAFAIAGSPAVVGEVELDLQPDRALLGVEPRLAQHPREHVEVALDLVAVALAVLAGEELRRGDVLAHGAERTRPPTTPPNRAEFDVDQASHGQRRSRCVNRAEIDVPIARPPRTAAGWGSGSDAYVRPASLPSGVDVRPRRNVYPDRGAATRSTLTRHHMVNVDLDGLGRAARARAPAARAPAARAARAWSRRGSCGARWGRRASRRPSRGRTARGRAPRRESSASRTSSSTGPSRWRERGHGEVALGPVDDRVGHDAAGGALEHALAAVGELERGRAARPRARRGRGRGTACAPPARGPSSCCRRA